MPTTTPAQRPEPGEQGEQGVKRPAYILPVIILSQFTGTSLWFAGNAVISDLELEFGLAEASIGYITSAVQSGFIVGTLVFAFLAIADRFSPRLVFFWCSSAGAISTLAVLVVPPGLAPLLLLRFTTGFFLAGIYPVGMKIAAAWYREELGRALGYLVGALVLGTAFPHLLRATGAQLSWQWVLIAVSLLAFGGAVMMRIAVPDGPWLPRGSPFDPRALAVIFRSRDFRASAFGYFGHMWELYTLWAFIPVWLAAYASQRGIALDVPLWSFAAIAIGFFGCTLGGLASRRTGSARVAFVQLLVSGICCLASPAAFALEPGLFLAFVLIWGITAAGDSPQFSALNAANAPRQYVGSALTIANSIGFMITVASIQLTALLAPVVDARHLFWILVPGPLLGLLALRPLERKRSPG